MGGASIWHWLVVGVIVLLLFGRGKVSEMMGDVAKGIKAFKKGMAEDDAPAATTTTTTVTTPATTVVEPVRTLDHQPATTAQAAPTAAAPAAGPLGERKAG